MTNLKINDGALFNKIGPAKEEYSLFSVNDGVNAGEALQYADDILSSIEKQLLDAFCDKPLKGDPAFLAHHSMKSARAVIWSIQGLIDDLQQQHTTESAGN